MSGAVADEESRPISRRRVFTALAGAAAAAWGTQQARAQVRVPVSADVDPGSLLNTLVRRTTMGITETEASRALSLGYSGYLEYQLNHLAIDDSVLQSRLAGYTTLTMLPYQLFPLPAGQVINELSEAAILRAAFSQRQLFERMVEFWTDHFNIDILNADDRWLKTVDDREVVRPHALGNFAAMLNASARSPAMLVYLDNNTSVAGSPNENYARELLELHTMGVTGGYTQQDVEEVARCFTGWTVFPRSAGQNQGLFRYNNTVHDQGQKIVLGNVIPANGGMQDGITVLNILIDHPSTARFISTKLARWLLGEQVSSGVIDSVAAAYTATRGDIKTMIRAALVPNVLADAPPKYKRPFHQFVSALRASGATIAQAQGIRQALLAAGHHPFYWGPPDGYPDTLAHWSGLILPRWNIGSSIVTGQTPGVAVDLNAFFAGATTARSMVDRINRRLFSGEMPASDVDRILAALQPDPPTVARRRDALALAIGSPGFQWY